jgi:hypothetical protein
MNDHLQRIQELMTRHPRLRPLLTRICTGLNQRGMPTGSLKLGDNLDRVQETEPLRLLFGRAVTESHQGKVTLCFDRLSSTVGTETLDSFFVALYAAVGIPREDRQAQRLEIAHSTTLLLARLRQQFPAFPDWVGVVFVLEDPEDTNTEVDKH